MKLFLLRHGKADWPAWQGADDDRPLTEEGIIEMRLAGEGMKKMNLQPEVIFTSPLPRAGQTAEIAAKALGAPLETRPELRPGLDRRLCDALLAVKPGADLMMVGHEPDFSRLIRDLTGGRVKLPKAGLAAIEMGETLPSPRLLWLIPPGMLIRLYA